MLDVPGDEGESTGHRDRGDPQVGLGQRLPAPLELGLELSEPSWAAVSNGSTSCAPRTTASTRAVSASPPHSPGSVNQLCHGDGRRELVGRRHCGQPTDQMQPIEVLGGKQPDAASAWSGSLISRCADRHRRRGAYMARDLIAATPGICLIRRRAGARRSLSGES